MVLLWYTLFGRPGMNMGNSFSPRKIQSQKTCEKKKKIFIYLPGLKIISAAITSEILVRILLKNVQIMIFSNLFFEIIYFPFYTIIANMLRLKPTPLLSTKCKNSSCKFSLIWKITLFRRNV